MSSYAAYLASDTEGTEGDGCSSGAGETYFAVVSGSGAN